MSEITNKVENSGIITVNLEDYLPSEEIVELDIADQLWQGMILKEKDFRDWIKNHEWEQYRDQHLAIYCSADAIVPVWAYMLIVAKTHGISASTQLGHKMEIVSILLRSAIASLDKEQFRDARLMIKGCGEGIPESAYLDFVAEFQSVVKTIMYGEPCGAVPVWKKPRLQSK